MFYNIFSTTTQYLAFYDICIMKLLPTLSFRLLTLFFILFLALKGMAAEGYFPIRNFSARQYGAGAQNWGMAQDALGRIYIANRDGLLRYDGCRWTIANLPNHTSVRSVCIDNERGRTYAGGTGEFGYFQASPTNGIETYHSISSLLPSGKRENPGFTEIWNIMIDANCNVWFQSDYSLYLYDGRHVKEFRTDSKISRSALVNNGREIALGCEDGSLFKASTEGLQPIGGAQQLEGKKITGILELNGSLLIATDLHGLYIRSGIVFSPFPTPYDPFLKENQLFCARQNGEDLVFGTVNAGALIVNFRTGVYSYINRDSGLMNNTVLNMGFSADKNLWLCLDNGLAAVFTDSPVRNLLGSNREIGAGYASMLYGDKLFLGTNQALFTIPWPYRYDQTPPRPEKILGGQVWSIDTIGKSLFISSDRGLFQSASSSPGSVHQIEGIPGSWGLRTLRAHPGYALAATYNGFYLLKQEGATLRNLGKMAGYSDAAGRFEEDTEGLIWLGHWLKGVYRMKVDPEKRRFSNIRLFTKANGLPSDRNNSVVIYKSSPIVATEHGIYRILPDGKAVRDDILSQGMPKDDAVHLFPLPDQRLLAFSSHIAREIHPESSGVVRTDSISLRLIGTHLIPGFENVGIAADNLIAGSQEGFYIINPARSLAMPWRPKSFVASVYADRDSLIYLASTCGKNVIPEIPYSLNSLRFEFAIPDIHEDNVILFSCFLENYDNDWGVPSASSSKEYTKLREGNYTLRLRAINTTTGEVSESSLQFKVLPPWWRSPAANIFYILFTLAMLYLSVRIIQRASSRAARRMESEKEKELLNLRRQSEQETLRKDYEIAALKSEQLEKDIKHKSSELSNITMNVIRKNEILLNISSRLEKLRDEAEEKGFPISADIEKIRKSISHNISHDDDWKNFNQNFDIVYENYTKRLMKLHPDLSKTELRICCYLKMGLSSKDIAPLFNISPRSVEMSRYRLRKKMGLERETNLTAYLQAL